MSNSRKEDPTVIQRVLSSSALALETTMIRLRRLKNAEPPKASSADETLKIDETLDSAEQAGRIEHDSRGSAVWNWAVETGAHALESTQRLLKRLESPALTLDEKPADSPSKPSHVERDTGGGYDPYNRGKPTRRR
jgi:hypothetical protein